MIKIKIILISFFLVFLLTSCEIMSEYKDVEVVITEQHPFETSILKELWYSVSWNDNKGIKQYSNLGTGNHSTILRVPKNRTVYVTARLIGEYYPLGGVILPGVSDKVFLNFEEGYLVDFLLELCIQNPESLEILNYPKLYQILKDQKLLYSFDKLTLARALMNGELTDNSFYHLDNIKIDISQVVSGYWTSDFPQEGSFWVSSSSKRSVYLSLGEGVHNYLNIEKGYIFTVIVDTRNNKYFINMKKIPEDFKT